MAFHRNPAKETIVLVKISKISKNIKIFPYFIKRKKNDGLLKAGNERRTWRNFLLVFGL